LLPTTSPGITTTKVRPRWPSIYGDAPRKNDTNLRQIGTLDHGPDSTGKCAAAHHAAQKIYTGLLGHWDSAFAVLTPAEILLGEHLKLWDVARGDAGRGRCLGCAVPISGMLDHAAIATQTHCRGAAVICTGLAALSS
jgi:hypothetical protein